MKTGLDLGLFACYLSIRKFAPLRFLNRPIKLKVFKNLDELEQHIGVELGPTEWKEVTQVMIDDFARATDDHQWIHVDQEKAGRRISIWDHDCSWIS